MQEKGCQEKRPKESQKAAIIEDISNCLAQMMEEGSTSLDKVETDLNSILNQIRAKSTEKVFASKDVVSQDCKCCTKQMRVKQTW